jgi:hypothetical protein
MCEHCRAGAVARSASKYAAGAYVRSRAQTYSENPICQSYLGSNCVAMGSGVKDDWPMQQPIPTAAGPKTWMPETD